MKKTSQADFIHLVTSLYWLARRRGVSKKRNKHKITPLPFIKDNNQRKTKESRNGGLRRNELTKQSCERINRPADLSDLGTHIHMCAS